MGLESFLLQMFQLQAVAQDFSCDLYLQANMSQAAARYYEHRGFVQMVTNNPAHLPETFLPGGNKPRQRKKPNLPMCIL